MPPDNNELHPLVKRVQRKIAEAKWKESTELDLRGCGLAELPEEIFELTHLEVLNLSNTWTDAGEFRNRIEKLSPKIAQLKNLRVLHIWDGRLKELPEEMSKLINLEELDISGNSFTYLPLVVTKIKGLKNLDLRHNHIEILSTEVTELKNLENIYLGGNPLAVPPSELAEQGTTSRILNYMKALKENPSFFYDAKIIFVGQPEVGKTTLMNSLIDENFELGNFSMPKTEDINVRTWDIPKEKTGFEQSFRLHMWDFGGDAIYHSVHRLFLTKNSIYLLLISKETALHDIYYWLQMIKTHGEGSPVLLIHSKTDELPIGNFPIQELKDNFENIVGNLQLVSCKFDRKHTIKDLEKFIISSIKKLPQIKYKTIPYAWVQLRQELKHVSINKPYITYEEYGKICQRYNLDKSQADSIANFLHDSGVFLHFNDEEKVILRQRISLDKNWVIAGIYLIFHDQSIRGKKGLVSKEELEFCLKGIDYEYNQDYIVAVMEKFSILFKVEGEKSNYFLPHLLPRDIPEEVPFSIYKRVPCTFVRKYTLRGNRFSIKQIWRGVLSVRKQLLIGDKSLSKTYYFSLRFCNYFLKDWKALVLVEMPPFQKRPFVKEKNP